MEKGTEKDRKGDGEGESTLTHRLYRVGDPAIAATDPQPPLSMQSACI